jgi:hypothetical protein
MKRITMAIWLLLLAALVVGCARSEQSESPAFIDGEAPVEETAGGRDDFAVDADIASNPMAPQSQVQERLIIRTGDMEILVADTEAVLAQIAEMAEGMEGWVVSSNVYVYNTDKAGTITIRVPAASFETAVSRIEGLALEVNRLTTSSQDVTEEFVDLQSRLTNLEATADRVRAFLDQAEDVEDALAVNQELSRLEGEIEVIKGRMQYLSQSAAFSTLTVNLTPDILSTPIEVGGWRPQGVAREAIEDLVQALQGLTDFGIRMALFVLPLLLVLALPLIIIALVVRRYLRRRRQSAVVTPAEAK